MGLPLVFITQSATQKKKGKTHTVCCELKYLVKNKCIYKKREELDQKIKINLIFMSVH